MLKHTDMFKIDCAPEQKHTHSEIHTDTRDIQKHGDTNVKCEHAKVSAGFVIMCQRYKTESTTHRLPVSVHHSCYFKFVWKETNDHHNSTLMDAQTEEGGGIVRQYPFF